MKLLGSTKKDVDSDRNGENVPKLESVEVVLVHYNLVKNDYQASKALEIEDNVNLTLIIGQSL